MSDQDCPFCGSDDLTREGSPMPREPEYVLCACCGASNTVADWNTRARPAPTGVDVEKIEDHAMSVEAWLYRWGSHVGACRGGDRCTCGLTMALTEAQAILNLIQNKEPDR